MADEQVIYEGDTEYGHYLVVDTIYAGRPARVLYSGDRQAAQSGVASDGRSDLLFDYNERFMELIRGLRPRRVLLIGGGAFTLPLQVQAELPETAMDIVELDPGLLYIARTHFSFEPADRMQVYNADGRRFLETGREPYDLIMVDAFNHTTIPRSLRTQEAALAYKRNLRPHGVLAMNIITGYEGERSALLRRQIASLRPAFEKIGIFPAGRQMSLWIPQNFVLIASSQSHHFNKYLRFAPLDLPAAQENAADHDEPAA